MHGYLAKLLLRLELTAVFAYAGFGTFFAPAAYTAWLPQGVFGEIPEGSAMIRAFALFEIALVLWIVANKRTDIAAIVAASVLVGVAFLNLNYMDVVFRNIGLAFGAVALYALEREEKKGEAPL